MELTKKLNAKQRRQLKKLLHRNNRKTQQEIIREFIIEYGSNPDPQIEDFDLHREELVTANIKSFYIEATERPNNKLLGNI